jgi:small-conductance mechanosensitive channel
VGDSALQLSLNFQVAEFVNQYNVQSELRKRIFKRFRKEGIDLAYPAQSVFVTPLPDGHGSDTNKPDHNRRLVDGKARSDLPSET